MDHSGKVIANDDTTHEDRIVVLERDGGRTPAKKRGSGVLCLRCGRASGRFDH